MELTRNQEKGLKIAVDRYKSGEPYTCISGYAGTGKSTLIQFIIPALGVTNDEVCYATFTGKAATVLQQKNCPNATTLHKLLYNVKPLPDGSYSFKAKDKWEFAGYKVFVIDEISMVPMDMWNLLLRCGVYILATGDPGQLPPVDRDQDNHVLDHPHVFLDEIMRQAKDSEIIRLSMWVREGKPLATFPQVREQVQIFNKNEVSMGMYEWADQIICATNRNRNQINNLMRQARGFGPEPTSGDRVISLRNHWNDFSNSGTWALTNGAIGTIEDFEKIDVRLPKPIAENPVTYLYANILLEDGDSFTRVPIDYKSIVDGTPALDGKQIYRLRQWKKAPRPPYEFAYAYAITCHKSQGSQWDKVLAFEETFPFEDTEHARWVYTAVTRAAQKLVVIKR